MCTILRVKEGNANMPVVFSAARISVTDTKSDGAGTVRTMRDESLASLGRCSSS